MHASGAPPLTLVDLVRLDAIRLSRVWSQRASAALGMAKRKRPAFYAVRAGRVPGVYTSWDECEKQVKGFSLARFKGFASREEAEQFVLGVESADETPPASTQTGPDKYIPPPESQADEQEDDPDPALEEAMQAWNDDSDPGTFLDVYTDGSSHGNGRGKACAGYGIYWADTRYTHLNRAKRLPGSPQTNNRAELTAILEAIRLHPHQAQTLRIYTDSSYAIRGITQWMPGWEANGWKTVTNKPVENQDLFVQIRDAMKQCRHRPVLVHVKGHAGNHGNSMADALANQGADMPPVDSDVPMMAPFAPAKRRKIN